MLVNVQLDFIVSCRERASFLIKKYKGLFIGVKPKLLFGGIKLLFSSPIEGA
jgi:hypothetical protein